MATDFHTAADDFFVNLTLETVVDLPSSSETVLHFCEAVRRQFPAMSNFYRREDEGGQPRQGPFVLEGDRESGSYQWMELQGNQLTAGWFNPPDVQQAFAMHAWLLDRSIYFLGVTGIDVEAVEILIGFNLDFQGNRDAVVASALLGSSPLSAVLGEAGAIIECEPNFVIALDEECCMQGRVYLATRSSSYQVRTGQFSPEPISVYMAIRSFPRLGHVADFASEFPQQCSACEDIARRIVVPNIVRPIASAIAAH